MRARWQRTSAFVCAGALCAVVLCATATRVVLAQPEEAAPPASTDETPAVEEPAAPPVRKTAPAVDYAGQTPEYLELGSTDCIICHSATGRYQRSSVLDRVSINEANIWHNEDQHFWAYRSILPQAKRMSAILGYDVRSDARCLNCHAPHAVAAIPANVAPEKWSQDVQNIVEEGVNCEACHGKASLYGDDHHKRRGWYSLPAEVKRQSGLTDIREPVARAKVCLSCHLGDAKQGRVLTHDMYAAGHPPIANFEMAEFSLRMPRHGKSLVEKFVDVKPDAEDAEWKRAELARLGYQPDELFGARQLMVADVAALGQSLELLADVSADAAKNPNPGQAGHVAWPEFALFDCAACHHDLKLPSWRQQRTPTAGPGRPSLKSWAVFLYESADSPAAKNGAANPLLSVDKALSVRPFGDPAKTAIAARTALDSVQQLTATVNQQTYDAQHVQSLFVQLLAAGKKQQLDYDTAAELAWILQSLTKELSQSKPAVWSPDIAGQVQATLKSAAGPFFLTEQHGEGAVMKAAETRLKAAAAFDAAEFQKQLGELEKLVRGADTSRSAARQQ